MILYPQGSKYYEEEEVELICEMLDRGYPVDQITKAVIEYMQPFPARNAHHYHEKAERHVLAVQADRWNWCTHRNPLTMQLAFEGNKDAWDSLNHYERRDVVLRLQYHMDNGIPHPKFSDLPILNLNEGSGLTAWCSSVGLEDPQHITNPFGRRMRIRKANAEAKANALVNA